MKKSKENFINKHSGTIAFGFVFIGFAIIIIFLTIAPFNDWSFDEDAELFAQYGDFIGGFIGTIFSLAGFFLIYKTLTTQQDTLTLQDSASRQDRFEITFFYLLKNQSDITNEIKAYFNTISDVSTEVTNTANGREFFIYSKRELQDIWNSLTNKSYLGIYYEEHAELHQHRIYDLYNPDSDSFTSPDEAAEKEKNILYEIRLQRVNKSYGITEMTWKSVEDMEISEKIKLMYGLYFQRYHYVAGHYFRHLYHILDFAETAKKDRIKMPNNSSAEEISTEFNKYVSFIQAQMSTYELMLLYYNTLSCPKTLELVKTYNFLEALTIEDLIDVSHNCIDGVKLKSQKNLL